MLEDGADPNMDRDGDLLLHLFAWMDNLPTIRLLLEYGANVYFRNERGTALHSAASNGAKNYSE